jgi:holliday junction DNA helicase RuvA
MIRSLTGNIASVTDGAVVIEVRGVGYLVGAPTKTTLFQVGEERTLHTHLAVRETALDLYGFTTARELELFEFLLLVPKVGPKSALQILSQASPTLLIESISKNDSQQLHKLSGIGKRTCENLVQYLHHKIEDYGFSHIEESPRFDGNKSDAIDALVSLGYDTTTARAAVANLDAELSVNELVTRALKRI